MTGFIQSAREGTDVTESFYFQILLNTEGFYFQDDAESMHFLEKRS